MKSFIFLAALALVGGAHLRSSPVLIAEHAAGKAASNATLGSLIERTIAGDMSVGDLKSHGDKGITFDDAMNRLQGKLPGDVDSLVKLTVTHKKQQAKQDPEFTEASLAKGRKYLNGMIEAAQKDLDNVMLECKEFEERNRETFSQTSNDIKRISGQISDLRRKQIGANEEIRSLTRQRREVLTDKRSAALGCEQVRLEKAADLQLKEDDLAVFDFILESTRCTGEDAAAFLQDSKDDESTQVCSTGGQLSLHFADPKKEAKLQKLLTAHAKQTLHDALSSVTVWQGNFLQMRDRVTTQINTTTVALPTFTVKQTPVKEEPAPTGQWKKCVNGKPNCGLLHDTMSVQWGIYRDLVDELKYEMGKDKSECDAIRNNLNEQLVIIGEAKTQSMTLLAETIASIQQDNQEMQEKHEQYRDLEHAYTKKMRECKDQVEEILFTNICAVRQVRDKLMSYSEETPPEKISDCDVEDWTPGDCSVDCDDTCPQSDPYKCGGWQILSRRPVVMPNEFGVQCPAFQMQKKCNQFKCRVNCVMSEWGGWSACSADCEGGEQQRTRVIMTQPKNGGQECDTTLDARSCNTESCDRDCTLNQWSEWSPCSMACGGGLQERVRTVLVPIRGLGKCPEPHHADRWEEQECNAMECNGDEICIAKQDLIVAIDASGSLKESGFEVLRDFTANLTGRYRSTYTGSDAARVGVLMFGQGIVAPDGTISGAEEVSPLTAEIEGLQEKIKALKWQKGITNMAQAFFLASRMLREKGREDAQSAVLVITDGVPSMKFATTQQVEKLKEGNTQIYFAPIANFPNKKFDILKSWASAPWETNYERIPGLLSLSNNFPLFAQRLLTKFCPDAFSPFRQAEADKNRGFMLIKEGGWPSLDCGMFTVMGRYLDVVACGLAVKEQGVLAFAYEHSGMHQGFCYAQEVAVTKELYEEWEKNATAPECPNGEWEENPYVDTYAIYPEDEEETAEA